MGFEAAVSLSAAGQQGVNMSKNQDASDRCSVSDFALGGRLRQRSTGRVGEVVRYDPDDDLLTFKLAFGDGQLPYADWFPGNALESLVADAGFCSERLPETAMLSRLVSKFAAPLFPSAEAAGSDRWGYTMRLGPRTKMEDAVVIAERMQPSTAQGSFTELYGVLDGHGGVGTVDFVKRNLATRILKHELVGQHEHMDTTLKDAFVRLDSDILGALVCATSGHTGSDSHTLSSGCCACVASICDSKLTIASVGDCRAILCSSSDPPKVTTLTRDHTPTDEDELSRLKSCGAEISCDGYLNSAINVSRAFGDLNLQTKEKLTGMISDPDVSVHALDDRAEFLLLGCDGIFEHMSAREAATEVRRVLRQGSSPQAAAEALVKLALTKDGGDNVTAVVVLFRRPPALERTAPKRFFTRSKQAA